MRVLPITALPGLVALLSLSVGALAEDYPDPDQRYSTVEQDQDQAIVLRQQPGPEGEAVAELPAGAGDITLSGAAIDAANAAWYEVLHEGERGWVEGSRLQAEGGGGADYPLLCTGTEPFWSLSVREDLAYFATPEVDEVEWTATDRLPARGLTGRFAIGVTGGNGTGYLAVMRARQYCTDGMSDIRYPFEALLITPAQAVRAGCCRRDG